MNGLGLSTDSNCLSLPFYAPPVEKTESLTVNHASDSLTGHDTEETVWGRLLLLVALVSFFCHQ